jgi:hypothetical protein
MMALLYLCTFAFVLLAFCAAAKELGLQIPCGKPQRVALLIAAMLTLLLLLRPDEQVESGEDPGVYFNASVSILRHGLSFQDPAMQQIPREERQLFRYGHDGFLITKNSVFWAEDGNFERFHVFFFPAYSLLIGVPALFGFPYGAYALSALLAVGCALLLTGLARRLWPHPLSGWLAYLLFFAHPCVAWNARALRAEWPATLLLLSGIVLWLPQALDTPAKPAPLRKGLLAGLALSCALLFHMTAIYVLLPALAAGALLTRRQRFWSGWWLGLLIGLGLFAAQTLWLTDPYWIRQTLSAPARAPLLLGALLLLPLLALSARWLSHKTRSCSLIQPVASLLLPLGFLAIAILSLRFRDPNGHIPILPVWTTSYISLTDFQGVYRTMSRPWFWAALLGLFALCKHSPLGRWLFFLLAPASLTIGWVVNYMFETRRMLSALVPLLILGTLAFLHSGSDLVLKCIANRPAWRRTGRWALPLLGALLLIAAGLRGRTQLFSVWNGKRTFGFYRDISARIAPEADFLFAEYTQTAVPIETLTGLPLLPLSWEYRTDAEFLSVETIWKRLVETAPGRRHVLISPFPGAAIPGLAQEPLFSSTLRTRHLSRARRDIPLGLDRSRRTLYVQRLLTPGVPASRSEYLRSFPGSRLGLRGAANSIGPRLATFQGQGFEAGESISLPTNTPSRLVLLLAFPQGVPPDPVAVSGGTLRYHALSSLWVWVELQPDGPGPLLLRSEEPGFLHQIYAMNGTEIRPLPLPGASTTFHLPSMDSQWFRAQSAIVAPSHPGTSWLWMLVQNGRGGEMEAPSLRVNDTQGNLIAEKFLPAEWTWIPFRLQRPSSATGVFEWLHFLTPPYDPGLPHFPDDLGFRIHALGVIPDPESTP